MESKLAPLSTNKILSALEVADKMEMGLCILCDEPFTLQHQSTHKNKNIQIVVMEKDEEEPEHKEYENQALNLSISTETTTTIPTKTPVPRDSESDFTSFLDGSKVNSGVLENKGLQLNRSLPIAAPTTVPTKTPSPGDLTPVFFDPSLTGDDGTEKSSIEDTPVADPTSVFSDLTKPHFRYFVRPPPSTTSFRLFGEDSNPAAAVSVIHIGPFDLGPPTRNHTHAFHSSHRYHFSEVFAPIFTNSWFSPNVTQNEHLMQLNHNCDMFKGAWVTDDLWPLYKSGSCSHFDEIESGYKNWLYCNDKDEVSEDSKGED